MRASGVTRVRDVTMVAQPQVSARLPSRSWIGKVGRCADRGPRHVRRLGQGRVPALGQQARKSTARSPN